MKLLLTSAGITNDSIAQALEDLVGKPFTETKIVFIPTAANIEENDKGWLIDDVYNIKKRECDYIDIVDISALPKDVIKKRLEVADVLFFGGGNTFHLMHWMDRSGVAKYLPELLQTRVYAGISAGSMVTNQDLSSSQLKKLYYESISDTKDMQALEYVDIYFRPHLNSPHFPNVTKEVIEKHAQEVDKPVYALDDDSALKIVDGKIEVVSEGEWGFFGV